MGSHLLPSCVAVIVILSSQKRESTAKSHSDLLMIYIRCRMWVHRAAYKQPDYVDAASGTASVNAEPYISW